MLATEIRHRYAGVEQADSLVMDPHKWWFAPFDSAALLYRNPQLARAVHTQDASYLDVIHENDDINPSDLAYHLTRRARGLPLWFSLTVHGSDAYRDAVEVALARTREAARHIDAWLRGTKHAPPPKREAASFERLNTWYYSDAPKTVQATLDVARRQSTFDEVTQGLDETTSLFEARRCLSCGNCFECDNCYGVCPDNAVIKLGAGKRFKFNYDYCKGCGLCAAECPCGAIRMDPEQI